MIQISGLCPGATQLSTFNNMIKKHCRKNTKNAAKFPAGKIIKIIGQELKIDKSAKDTGHTSKLVFKRQGN